MRENSTNLNIIVVQFPERERDSIAWREIQVQTILSVGVIQKEYYLQWTWEIRGGNTYKVIEHLPTDAGMFPSTDWDFFPA